MIQRVTSGNEWIALIVFLGSHDPWGGGFRFHPPLKNHANDIKTERNIEIHQNRRINFKNCKISYFYSPYFVVLICNEVRKLHLWFILIFVSHENNVRSFVCTYKRRQEALSVSINLINHIHNLKIYVQAFLFLYTSNLIHFHCLTWTRAKNLKLLDLGFWRYCTVNFNEKERRKMSR